MPPPLRIKSLEEVVVEKISVPVLPNIPLDRGSEDRLGRSGQPDDPFSAPLIGGPVSHSPGDPLLSLILLSSSDIVCGDILHQTEEREPFRHQGRKVGGWGVCDQHIICKNVIYTSLLTCLLLMGWMCLG